MRAAASGALLVAVLLLFFGALLDPRNALATRDMLEFHLPLRAVWAQLSAISSFPQWDPFAHGGQPLLSNPNYGALYPPSWLARLLPVTTTVSLLAFLHAALAAWGAERLARRLGADRSGALLAAVAYACGPTYLSLLHSLPLALGMSWLPWVLALALECAASGVNGRPGVSRPALGLSFSFAMLVITGDPVLLLMTALALAVFLAVPWHGVGARLLRVAPPLLLGLGLSAAQLVPTLARLARSPRAAGLPWEEATAWSLPWKRLPELFFPTFYGDSAQPMTGLYFGWGIHDRDFPYLVLLAIGTPLLLLAVAGGTYLRSTWSRQGALLAGCGLLLALGRHDPLYRWLFHHAPGFGSIRYPEKFALLTLTALVFLGALAWTRILDERDRGSAQSAELPFAFALLLSAVTATFTLLAHRVPALVESFVRSHSGWPLPPALISRAADYLRGESRFALTIAISSLVLFALARWSRLPRRALELAALTLVVAELWTSAGPLVRTMPAKSYLAPPPVAKAILPGPGRLFSNQAFRNGRQELVLNAGNVVDNWARAPFDRLHSRTANLLGKAYAFDGDYDLTFTPSAERALTFYGRLRDEPDLAHRLLGAWGVEQLLIGRAPEEILEDLRHGKERPDQVRIAPNSYVLPQVRFVGSFAAYPSASLAEEAATAARLPLLRTEFLIGDVPGGTQLGVGQLTGDRDAADRRWIEYTSAEPTLLVIATTFDRRWQAAIDSTDLPLFETAGGYLAAPVPAGRHLVVLHFRDPWFSVGAAVTLLSLLVALLLALRTWRSALRTAGAAPASS